MIFLGDEFAPPPPHTHIFKNDATCLRRQIIIYIATQIIRDSCKSPFHSFNKYLHHQYLQSHCQSHKLNECITLDSRINRN